MRKHYFLLSILVLSISLSVPQTLRGQQPTCMANSNIPAGYVPFTSIYYISGRDEAGDLLVVGSMSFASFQGLSGVPLPGVSNQQFCNPITLAPGIVANAYVPTITERGGTFTDFSSVLFNPNPSETCPAWSGGVIPSGCLPSGTNDPGYFAWRIPAKQPGPPVYVSTGYGGQILAVDGSSGVTSVLYSWESESSDLEGLTVGPDNLIYFTDPSYGYIYRIDQHGGSFATVYDSSTDQTGPVAPQGPSFSTTGLLAFNTTDDQGVWQISFGSSDTASAPSQLISPGTGVADGQGTTYNHADELLIVESPYGGNIIADVLQQTGPGLGSATPLIGNSYLSWPVGVAVNSSGNIFVSNWEEEVGGYILQFDSAGNPLNTYSCDGVCQGHYVSFGSDEQPLFMQFDASDRLYVVTQSEGGGKVWRVDPSGPYVPNLPAPTGTATLLIDLGYASSNGTVPNLNGSSAVGVALPGTGTGNSYTTPPKPITPGTPVTYTYGNITNQTITIPTGSNLGGAAFIAVDFQLWNPSVFDTTRLPATSTNGWSGGTPVLSGTTCTPIAGTGGNCIVIEDLCFDSNGKQIPCQIFAPSGSLILLTSMYQTQSPQPNPGLIIADDGGNDWANITTGYSATDPLLNGGSKGVNTDTAIVNLGLGIVSPASLNFGAVYLGTITIKSVTVTNYGTAPMTITDPLLSILSGGDSHEFVALNLCPRSLAAGKSCRIEVAFFAGPNYTLQTAVLNVVDSAPGSPQSVLLSATVINPQAHLSATSLSFGTQNVNSSSAQPKAVTLKSTGATALTITSIAIAGTNPLDFVQTNNCPSSLAANAGCTINVTFTPTAKGLRSASVVITDNARNSPQKISLSGTGR